MSVDPWQRASAKSPCASKRFQKFLIECSMTQEKSVSFSLIPLQIGLFKTVFLEIDITDRWGICITSISMHPHSSCQTGISPSAEWGHSSQVSSHWIFWSFFFLRKKKAEDHTELIGGVVETSYQKLLFKTVQVKEPTLFSEHAEEFVCDLIKGW